MLTNGVMKLEAKDVFDSDMIPSSETKLESIRKISNVVQALENLIVQCEDLDAFQPLQSWAKKELNRTFLQMRRQIHQD